MPLAVLGGSFDPVHSGHVEMARHVLKCGLARNILIIPASHSPFKKSASTADSHRLAMTRLAFSGDEFCTVDDREIIRGGDTYMVETLESLKGEHPNRQLRLIIGQDNVADFTRWHRFQDILNIAQVLVLGRQRLDATLPDELPPSFIPVPGFDQRVSSTEIRAILASGQPANDLLPEGVQQYIQAQGLYR